MNHTARRQAPGYGRGSHSIGVEELGAYLVDSEEVKEIVRTVMSSPDYRPPMLPAAALEVHRLSMQSRVDFSAVVSVLERDQMLASNLLRIAQSPLYARRIPPASLRDAVSRLGLASVRDIVFGVAFGAKVFRAPGYSDVMETIRSHSVATAHVARLLARGTPVADYAFLCGLLHDVGTAAVVLALADAGRQVAPEALASVLEELHEAAGELLFEAWGLPADLRLAISGHHYPKERVGALAHVAHVVTTESGRGLIVGGIDADPTLPAQMVRACAILRLGDAGLEKLRAEAVQVLEQV